MTHAFLVTGSNASGKTTTVARVLGIFDRHQESRIFSIRADNDGRFKGSSEDQEAVLTELWLSDTPVLVIEGTRINTPLMRVAKKHAAARKLTVIMATQTPEVMGAHLRARCEKKGKTFRADYWTRWKLEYEGMKRYPNSFRKNGIKPQTFAIDKDYKVCDAMASFLEDGIRAALVEHDHS
jgi:hypothetical protein